MWFLLAELFCIVEWGQHLNILQASPLNWAWISAFIFSASLLPANNLEFSKFLLGSLWLKHFSPPLTSLSFWSTCCFPCHLVICPPEGLVYALEPSKSNLPFFFFFFCHSVTCVIHWLMLGYQLDDCCKIGEKGDVIPVLKIERYVAANLWRRDMGHLLFQNHRKLFLWCIECKTASHLKNRTSMPLKKKDSIQKL